MQLFEKTGQMSNRTHPHHFLVLDELVKNLAQILLRDVGTHDGGNVVQGKGQRPSHMNGRVAGQRSMHVFQFVPSVLAQCLQHTWYTVGTPGGMVGEGGGEE